MEAEACWVGFWGQGVLLGMQREYSPEGELTAVVSRTAISTSG